jgi:hypothetical protein
MTSFRRVCGRPAKHGQPCLCRSCNLQEGHHYEPGWVYERYRARNPAGILGLRIRYYHPIFGYAEPEPERPVDLDRSPAYVIATYMACAEDDGSA